MNASNWKEELDGMIIKGGDLNLTSLGEEYLLPALNYIIENKYEIKALRLANILDREVIVKLNQIKNISQLIILGTDIVLTPDLFLKLNNLKYLKLYSTSISSIGDLIRNLNSLENLEVSYCKTTKSVVLNKELKNLRKVSITHSYISLFEGSFNNLPNLESLNLSNNELKVLPESLFQVPTLRRLNVRRNLLNEIPEKIALLTNLEELDASANYIERLPDSFGDFKELEYLNLESNYFNIFPDNICRISALKFLNLSGRGSGSNSKMISIPDAIGELHNLEFLNLSGHLIKRLPESIKKLVKLRELDISSNRISAIEDYIGDLKLLKRFDARTNQITKLSDAISSLENLEVLRLTGNRLEKLPENFYRLNNLNTLELTRNRFKNLPIQLAKLSKLRSFQYDIDKLEEDSLFKIYGLAEIARLSQYEEKESYRIGLLRLPDILRTAFQRYFAAFDDFWKDVTGKDLAFKVSKHSEGLEIEVELNSQVSQEDVELRLNQYFHLISTKNADLKRYLSEILDEKENLSQALIRAEVRISQLEQDIRIVELQNKLIASQAREAIQNKEYERIHLERENDYLKHSAYSNFKLLENVTRSTTIVNNYISPT